MRYLPHTAEEIAEMLAAIGKSTTDELFATIPSAARRTGALDLEPALAEAVRQTVAAGVSVVVAAGNENWDTGVNGSYPDNYAGSFSVGFDTFDNGGEFAQHPRLAKALDLEVYFARPHSPWQRGTNEHTNGLVRQFLPKGSSFRDLSHAAVARIQSLLNERPRKRLGYLTPKEALANASDATVT